MQRRGFFKLAAAAATMMGAGVAQGAGQNLTQTGVAPDVVIERAATGQPGKGKVLALITPHLDDGPGAGCGTVAKLLKEGYTGYYIRVSNDEKDSYDLTMGETVAANERDANDFVKICGLKQRFDLGYRNHKLDDVAPGELRSRLVFLFRLLKVDTVITFDPWGHYEENPDHYITGQAVEAACWMSGLHLDFPEHFAAGLKPHYVRERYYFARGPQLVNRVVDIAPTLETKIACLRACRTMVIHTVRDRDLMLAQDGQPVPPYMGDGQDAIDEYVRTTLERCARAVGEKYGLQYAEAFHYIRPSQWQEQDILPPSMQA